MTKLFLHINRYKKFTFSGWGTINAGAMRNAEYPFIAIAPRSTLARSGST